jgi:hypothetical protein
MSERETKNPRAVGTFPLSEFITEFLDGCGIEPPFYFVAISTNGYVLVTHWPAVGEVQEVCERIPEELAMLPIVFSVISLDGRGASARIEVTDDGPRLLH